MQVTIDSAEPLDRVLPVINALYGVALTLPEPSTVVAKPASEAPRRSRAKKAPTQQTGRRNKRATATAGTVRDWARSNGYEVSSRGRLSTELLEAYRTAT